MARLTAPAGYDQPSSAAYIVCSHSCQKYYKQYMAVLSGEAKTDTWLQAVRRMGVHGAVISHR